MYPGMQIIKNSLYPGMQFSKNALHPIGEFYDQISFLHILTETKMCVGNRFVLSFLL